MVLSELNNSELVELIYRRTLKRISKKEPREKLIEIINGAVPLEKTIETRKKLQVFIEKNFDAIQTNLPCRGSFNAGKCTIFPCTDVMHKCCYLGAKEYL